MAISPAPAPRASTAAAPAAGGMIQPGTRLAVAARHAGANANALSDGMLLDPLSGHAVLNGIPVELSPA